MQRNTVSRDPGQQSGSPGRAARFSDHAFTGLEAAIVLIAFVVVAAVFSYVVLGAGFFTTQKSQEVVQTSLKQASSSVEVIGNVYGMQNGTNNNLGYIKFTIGTTAGGTSVDISKMVVSYQDSSTRWGNLSFTPGFANAPTAFINNQTWGINQTFNDIGTQNYLLDPGEQFNLIVGVPVTTTPGIQFTANLQPAVGAVYQIKRTVPPAVNPINILT